MSRLIILGSGAAPGVPSISEGWGRCNSHNYKNRRTRTGTYIEYRGLRFLIDTSPDLRAQLLANNIKELDVVLYTHAHADHVNGIDELREINRYMNKSLDFYAIKPVIKTIRSRFDYLVAERKRANNFFLAPSLVPTEIKINKETYIDDIKIVPIQMLDHKVDCVGYVFDEGEIVHIADFKRLPEEAFGFIKKRPKIMVVPMTTMEDNYKHANLEQILKYVQRINPEICIINHMSTDCDYDEVEEKLPENVFPAYDNMVVEF